MIMASLGIGLLCGAALGAYVAWSLARSRCQREVAEIAGKSAADIASTSARLDEWSRRIDRLESDLAQRGRELEQAHAESSAVRQERARIAAELEAERRTGAEKLALVQAAEVRMREAFEALSSDALRRNNTSFLELAKASLDGVPAGRDRRSRAAADGDHGAGDADQASRSRRSIRSCTASRRRARRRTPSCASRCARWGRRSSTCSRRRRTWCGRCGRRTCAAAGARSSCGASSSSRA